MKYVSSSIASASGQPLPDHSRGHHRSPSLNLRNRHSTENNSRRHPLGHIRIGKAQSPATDPFTFD